MNNNNPENEGFQYTYCAKEQEELRRIRSKYVPQEESKLQLLRRLDAQVTGKASLYAILVGVFGAIILGIGMSCTMVWGGPVFVPGIVVGLIGLALVALAYPVYNRTLQKERARIAPQILRLTEELMK